MSKAIHKCTVEGDYIKKEAGGKVLDRYELTFHVPHLGDDKHDTHYLSVIKKELLQKQLKAKYPRAITFRTHELIERKIVTPSGKELAPANETPEQTAPQKQKLPSSMNKVEITEYIQENEYQIDFEVYNTLDKLRKAVKSYETDAKVFLKEQAEIKAEIDLKKTLADLNPTESTDEDIDGEEGDENTASDIEEDDTEE